MCDKRLRGELKQKPVAMIALLIAYLLTSKHWYLEARTLLRSTQLTVECVLCSLMFRILYPDYCLFLHVLLSRRSVRILWLLISPYPSNTEELFFFSRKK